MRVSESMVGATDVLNLKSRIKGIDFSLFLLIGFILGFFLTFFLYPFAWLHTAYIKCRATGSYQTAGLRFRWTVPQDTLAGPFHGSQCRHPEPAQQVHHL